MVTPRQGKAKTASKKGARKAASSSRPDPSLIKKGSEAFTIAGRIVREFGERLVKQPEVALLELIKNAYDADAESCTIDYRYPKSITVTDNGHGMTIDEFINGWMRIGTASKQERATSRKFKRPVSGEKGIGRFAVSYLGRHLSLTTVAIDPKHGKTELTAEFDWPKFDQDTDLGIVTVPYQLRRAAPDAPLGTTLHATKLRVAAERIDFRQVQTGSLGLLSAYRALLRGSTGDKEQHLPQAPNESQNTDDPGFRLIVTDDDDGDAIEAANAILKNYVLRAVVSVNQSRMELRVYRKGNPKPVLKIEDKFDGAQGRVYADLRFFPARGGTFSGMPVDGRLVRTWLKENSGVAVFDRDFRVLPYGLPEDDWLRLGVDTNVNLRAPRSSVANKHFPMDKNVQASTQLNYMLRLPERQQLVGAVQVYGTRTKNQSGDGKGLIATADRQGFINNQAFTDLFDVVRGAVEAIAYCDRELQLETDRLEVQQQAAAAREQTKEAIAQVQANQSLSPGEKRSIVTKLTAAQDAMSRSEDLDKSREAALEVMSLLGVVAGFMTHEFGTAITELKKAEQVLIGLSKKDPAIAEAAQSMTARIKTLTDFVTYSQGYIKGAGIVSEVDVPAMPRVRQVIRYFGKYAADRGIAVNVDVHPTVMIPKVPLSLYGGIVLNLYTNALKAVTAKAEAGARSILISAEEQNGRHRLIVADTGVGIPTSLNERIFDPLFTTTDSQKDPLRSGMGLGLTLVRRAAKAFGGSVRVTTPPDGYVTCFEVTFPYEKK
ncbi:Adaptive-response sensory-kinase SasA [Xanthomonas arboricola]|uniref:sensor histidine kinase n=1 Tax=Xanthomonas arboricola TaxID=56448 RepID=UPI001E5B471B|nr:sensor histidine kinase [Xanthomonas arboricola]CAE6762220.1 Adaptive-response sensory-kinase SasA [Xanthomonas arboricola]CAE6762252.1 Adaptive-response sensory-kinase SasA [Xanthomonas arboricola]